MVVTDGNRMKAEDGIGATEYQNGANASMSMPMTTVATEKGESRDR